MNKKNKKLLIAVDGPAASGKGSVAKMLAKKYNLVYLDTGKLYRALAFKYREKYGVDKFVDKEKAAKIAINIDISDTKIDGLEKEEIGVLASKISVFSKVRKNLFQVQRNVVKNDCVEKNGAILDGRDIATVICPEADYKFFITADIENRAERRYKQLQLVDKSIIYPQILQDLIARDKADTARSMSPLMAAEGSIIIDTSDLSLQAVFEKIVSLIGSRNE